MAYIGQNADGNFTTTPAKDTFNGDGSTVAFTLSQGGATNTVDVFVENVRQEPTEAYSVDGTTLTFTEAPGTGTGNIYVVNRGPAQLTATHPAGQALEAYSGTFSTDLTVDTDTLHVDSTNNRVGIGTTSPSTTVDAIGSSTNGSGVVDTIRVRNTGTTVGDGGRIQFTSGASTSGAGVAGYGTALNEADLLFYAGGNTERMRINSNGYVTMPNQPVISIGINTTAITDAAGVDLFGVTGRTYIVDVSQGITHNTTNGRFTVPVDGMYLISFYSMKDGSGTAYLQLKVNGSDWLRPYSSNNASGFSAYSVQGVRDLSANDYINVSVGSNSASAIAYGLQHLRLVIQKIS